MSPIQPAKYRESGVVIQQPDLNRLFPVRVLSVDSARPALTLQHQTTREVFGNVTRFPSAESSPASTDLVLPNEGTCGMAEYIAWGQGSHSISVVCWIPSDIRTNLDAIAFRTVTDPEMTGYSTRRRGVHRKPYPGQRSATSSTGLHQFEDSGWDRLTRDLSEDCLDSDRRERVQLTGRSVDYTEAGLRFTGPVNRPGADLVRVPSQTLPDGSTRQVVLLSPGTPVSARYLAGTPDLLPLVESLERVAEFGLDHPVPRELLESGMLDGLLGVAATPWSRTGVLTHTPAAAPTATTHNGGVQYDDQDYMIAQDWDHPTDVGKPPLGPSTREGASPRRRGWIAERVTGTLVGYHRADTSTYGRVLKPVLFPLNPPGRFETSPETGFAPVVDSPDHTETRLAAAAQLTRFPYDYNTTRFTLSKEGQVQFEIGATLPRENIGLDLDPVTGLSGYEHPYGAGRSIEGHVVGSTRMLLGKNRDEEDSLDLRTIGQVVLRLGADDGALPDAGRSPHVQNRQLGDAMAPRSLQYWTDPKLTPGDAGSLDAGMKLGAENVSLRAALDGGSFLRLGARNPLAKRRHLMNGYADGPGRNPFPPGTGNRSSSAGRAVYGQDDATYRFHDLTTAGANTSTELLYMPSTDCISDMNQHGLSADIHAVRDILLRVGKNQLSDYSILLDLEGGIIGIVGKDKHGTSLKTTMQGGIEMSIGSNASGQAMALEVIGDVNWAIQGNWQVHVTGDIVFDSMSSIYSLAKGNHVTKGTSVYTTARAKVVQEAPDHLKGQGWSQSPLATAFGI